MIRKWTTFMMSLLFLFALIACDSTTTAATTATTQAPVTTTQTTTTQPTTTTTAPTTASPYLFDYDWESSEWDGEQAFNDGEGDNFMLMDGYANTIDNLGTIGPASSWAFGYTPYDMNIGEATIEAKVIYNESRNPDEIAVFSIRHLYAMHYDLQIFFENGDAFTGVRFYNSSVNVLGDSTDITKGGQMSGQQFVANEEYVVKLIYDYTGETTTDLYVYVNDILEIYLTNVTIQNANGKFGIGASVNTSLKVDYFRAYVTDPETLTTPLLKNVQLFRGWEFDEAINTAGSTILGDAYVEGSSFAANGDGWLRTQVSLGGEFGPANGWSSARTGYDMGIPTNHIFQYKVNATTLDGTGSAVAVLRPSHAIYCDFQFVMSANAGESGVYVYKQGSAWASNDGFTFGLAEDHIVTIIFKQTLPTHATSSWGTYDIFVLIDGILVLTIEDGESAGPAASIALAATGGSDVMIDFLRIYSFE